MAGTAFGDRLRRLRKEAHLTQQDVADTLRIHRTTYTKYETGVVAPDQQGLLDLAKLFEVTVDYLLGNSEVRYEVSDAKGVWMDLTLQEQLLVQLYRQLDSKDKDNLLNQAQKEFRRRDRK